MCDWGIQKASKLRDFVVRDAQKKDISPVVHSRKPPGSQRVSSLALLSFMATPIQQAGLPLFLPVELLIKICCRPDLSINDLKCVRLANRAFYTNSTSLIFHRVFISNLRRDLEAFKHITSTPHIASVVREVVFLEVPDFVTYEHELLHRVTGLDATPNQFALCHKIADNFCKPNEPYFASNYPDRHTRPLIDAVSVYRHLLGSMSKLTTLASEPISTTRLLVFGADIEDPTETNRDDCEALIKDATVDYTSFPVVGFRAVFPPLLSCPKLEVSSLVCRGMGMKLFEKYGTEGPRELLRSLAHKGHMGANNFARLTSIDLDFSWLIPGDISECLAAAAGLRKLLLRVQKMEGPEAPEILASQNDEFHFRKLFCTNLPWNRLEYMRITNIPFSDGDLSAFVLRHPNLRQMHVDDQSIDLSETEHRMKCLRSV
ncbi:hypothetical protein CFIO01_12810 [Colletotrichum fioriniae PJ7]|uniref:Uncharacterized protein n=1 Tax=Colletotrichum fioriniae PJ7 TaxID=1445577 RepID=A0A010Q8M2_9PEZI|nr:hypothetical protein CFIO01_12810 [Colletotrichum fioriniae PJ7]